MSVIGITGTRAGTTPQQHARMASYIRHPATQEVHHGDCVGVDLEAHRVAAPLAGRRIIVHPPTDGKERAYAAQVHALHGAEIVVKQPKDYLARNRDIVDACDTLLAVPHGPEQLRGSGTWAAIRYARKIKRQLVIIWPDGTTVRENFE